MIRVWRGRLASYQMIGRPEFRDEREPIPPDPVALLVEAGYSRAQAEEIVYTQEDGVEPS